ncbi:MAG: bifunctional precorrin-2 dehydrogenase/sirohydrochlorin ferrochelatase [Pseudomonadota bacterium]
MRRPSIAPGAPATPTLARLPVFLDLAGQRVVVVGSTRGARWKVSMLLGACATVDWYTGTEGWTPLDEPLDEQPRLRVYHRCWSTADLADAKVAIGDFLDDDEAGEFVRAGHLHGALVNVIDKPDVSDFCCGSIVTRGAAVVGISTAGHAPVVAQRIRREIENVLPTWLDGWMDRARDVRGHIRHWSTEKRRRFWTSFADLAFARPVKVGDEPERLIRRLDVEEAPKVTLLCLDSPNSDALSVLALRRLQCVDTVFYHPRFSGCINRFARRESHQWCADVGDAELLHQSETQLSRDRALVVVLSAAAVNASYTRAYHRRLTRQGIAVEILHCPESVISCHASDDACPMRVVG